jgi:hypothetical protein
MSNGNARCRSCGERILWAETVKGRRIPIDVQPAHDGNIRLEPQGQHAPPLAIVLTGQIENNTQRWRSHFASCPNAAQHRRTK